MTTFVLRCLRNYSKPSAMYRMAFLNARRGHVAPKHIASRAQNK